MLFHSDVYLPEQVASLIPKSVIKVDATSHAKQAAKSDRYGEFELPSYINLKFAKVFEIEIINNRLTKFAVRERYDNQFDIVMVITRDYNIKTAWLNENTDRHFTLDKNKYESS